MNIISIYYSLMGSKHQMNGIWRKPTPGTCDGIDNYGNKTGKNIEYHPAGTYPIR